MSDIEDIDANFSKYNFCISLKGYYYIDELINRFHYLSLVVQDTPIYNKEYFKRINSVFPLSNNDGYQLLSKRKETVDMFIEYLKTEEAKEIKLKNVK